MTEEKKKLSMFATFDELQAAVLNWADERKLLHSENALKQFAKTVSELGELGDAIIKQDKSEQVDAIGDTLVCLIVLSNQLGFDVVDCLEDAYNVIKSRTGKTVNGTFIKD